MSILNNRSAGPGPSEAFCAVTYRCNCQCSMCDVWQKESVEEVDPSYYYKLPQSLRLVNLTGGEPFLRKDLVDIAEVISDRCRGVQLHLSTNGLLTNRIVAAVEKILNINKSVGVRISLDGIGENHNRIRGVPGAYEKALATLVALQKIGLKDLGLAFTMISGNEDQLLLVYQEAKKLGVDFTTAIAHSSPIFFGEQKDNAPEAELGAAALVDLRQKQLQSLGVKQWFRAYFTDGQIDYLKGRARKIHCGAIRKFIFVNPDGTVYPCPILNKPLGRLDKSDIEGLVTANPSILGQVDKCKLNCWMICTARPVMRENMLSCLKWIGSNKLRLAGSK